MSLIPAPKRASSRRSLTTRLPSHDGPSEPLAVRMPGGKGKGRAASIGPAEFASRGIERKPLSPKKLARRALVPRKSILKPYNPEETQNYTQGAAGTQEADDDDDDDDDDDENETQFRNMPGESTTMRILRRVSFAAHAHVRMFETANANTLSQSQSSTTSSVGSLPPPSPAPPSSNLFEEPVQTPTPAPSSSRRRSSLKHQSATAAEQQPTLPKRSRRSSIAEFGSDGSADMSMEEEDGDTANFFGLPSNSHPSLFDEAPESTLLDQATLDFTQAHGAILPPHNSGHVQSNLLGPLSPSASTLSPPSSPDRMPNDGEEQTLDFTVATGGIIPAQAPEFAVEGRGSVGYRMEASEAERLDAWSQSRDNNAGEEDGEGDEMDLEQDEDDRDGMELTGVVGGIFGNVLQEDRTDTGGPFDEGEEMEETVAFGGLLAPLPAFMNETEQADEEFEMDETLPLGGVVVPARDSYDEEDANEDGGMEMEETVALGGVLAPRLLDEQDPDNEDSTQGFDQGTDDIDFTIAQGGIFEPPIDPSPSTSGFASDPSKSGSIKSPRKSISSLGNTRPRASALTRPTLSSTLKSKPNVFDSPEKPTSNASPAKKQTLPSFSNTRTDQGGNKRRASHIDGARIFGKVGENEEGLQRGAKRRASSATAGKGVLASSSTEASQADDVFGLNNLAAVPRNASRPEHANVFPAEPPSEETSDYVVEEIIERSEENPPSPKKKPTAASPRKPTNLFELSPKDPSGNGPSMNVFGRTDSPPLPPAPVSASYSNSPAIEALVFPLETQTSEHISFDVPLKSNQTHEFDIFNSPPKTFESAPQPSIFDSLQTLLPSSSSQQEATPEATVPAATASQADAVSPVHFQPVTNTPRKRLGRPSLAAAPLKGKGTEDAFVASNTQEPTPEIAAPQVSLTQFLELTNLNWREKMSAGKRRSTIRPGEMLGIHRFNADSTTRSSANGEYLTMDYANHVLNLPYLIVYQWACNHLKDSTSQSQKNVQVLDEEASVRNPVLFSEYLEADDQEKVLIEGQLKYLKVFAQHTVKNKWREWRMDLVDELKASHEEDLSQLSQDRDRLQEIKKSFHENVSLVDLKARYEALKVQLAEEKAKVDEVLACDPEVLSHRRAEVKEQKAQIDSLKADLTDSSNVLLSLRAKAEALENQKEACLKVINHAAEYFSGSNVSSAEKAFKLKDEFDKIEMLHSIRLTSRFPDRLTFVILGDLELSLACQDERPLVTGATLCLIPDQRKPTRRNSALTNHLFELVKTSFEGAKFTKASQLFQHVYQLWSSSIRIAQEFALISTRYPVVYTHSAESSIVKAEVTMLVPSAKAKAKVAFSVAPRVLLNWPSNIKNLTVDVEVCYGQGVQQSSLNKTIQNRLSMATQETPTGILVDACLEAVASYEHPQ